MTIFLNLQALWNLWLRVVLIICRKNNRYNEFSSKYWHVSSRIRHAISVFFSVTEIRHYTTLLWSHTGVKVAWPQIRSTTRKTRNLNIQCFVVFTPFSKNWAHRLIYKKMLLLVQKWQMPEFRFSKLQGPLQAIYL